MPWTQDETGNISIDPGNGQPPMTFAPGQISPDTLASMGPPAAPVSSPSDVPWWRNKNAPAGLPGGDASSSAPSAPLFDPSRIAENRKGSQISPIMAPAAAPAPIADAGMSIDPATVSEQANMSIAPVTTAPAATTTPKPAEPTKASGGAPNPFGHIFGLQDKAFIERKAAEGEMSAVREAHALEESGVQSRLDKHINSLEGQQKTQRDLIAKEQADGERNYTAAVEDFRKMKVEPDHFWSTKSAGQKFALGLAAVIGAVGQSFTGKESAAIAVINRDIDRDIAIQKDAIMNAREGVSMKGNIVAQLKAKEMSFEQAALGAKQVMLEGAKRQLDGLAAQYKTPEIEAQNKMVQAQINNEIAQTAKSNQVFLAQLSAMRAQTAATQAQTAALGFRQNGKQLNEGTAKELGEANAATRNAQGLMDDFKKSGSDGVMGWLLSKLPKTEASRYTDRLKASAQVIGGYLEGGKMTDADVERYQSMLPESGDSEEKAVGKIQGIVKSILIRQQEQKKALAGSGYNVSGIADAQKPIDFQAAK